MPRGRSGETVSIHLSRLDERTALLAAQLVPPAPRHADLVQVLRRWGAEDIELESSQALRILDAIRKTAIPVSRAVVRSIHSPELREEGADELSRWHSLEAMLAEALAWEDEPSDALPLSPVDGCEGLGDG